jgi:hypothetical protein
MRSYSTDGISAKARISRAWRSRSQPRPFHVAVARCIPTAQYFKMLSVRSSACRDAVYPSDLGSQEMDQWTTRAKGQTNTKAHVENNLRPASSRTDVCPSRRIKSLWVARLLSLVAGLPNHALATLGRLRLANQTPASVAGYCD